MRRRPTRGRAWRRPPTGSIAPRSRSPSAAPISGGSSRGPRDASDVPELPAPEPAASLTGAGAVDDAGAGHARRPSRSAAASRQRSKRRASEAEELIEQGTRLGELADDLVEEMEFGFLFDRQRGLFSIGYNVTDGRLDASFYDALASEARLASFVAIATGQIPHEHWFKLGRSLTPTGTARALLSWSASMFEYFMPLLVMRAYPGTLLDETYRAVIERQMQYGAQHACRGASPSRPTTPRTSSGTTSTARSACPGSV